ncbi:MAG: hypothetical protein IJU61_06405 [Victivallales bacterium]|nr:hypothetical protein [Victivallales bacterium]
MNRLVLRSMRCFSSGMAGLRKNRRGRTKGRGHFYINHDSIMVFSNVKSFFAFFWSFFSKKTQHHGFHAGMDAALHAREQDKSHAPYKSIHDFHDIKHDNHRAAIDRSQIIHVEPRKARKTRNFSPQKTLNKQKASPPSRRCPEVSKEK